MGIEMRPDKKSESTKAPEIDNLTADEMDTVVGGLSIGGASSLNSNETAVCISQLP